MNKVHFFSESCEWSTPPELFAQINSVFNFETDVCANAGNAKCSRFFDVATDGLSQNWSGTCWMNPPYGRVIAKWMSKAYRESRKRGVTIVCLVPARTDTEWFQSYAMRGKVHFIRGRIKFGGHKNSAPFPSAVVMLGGNGKLWSRLQQQLTAVKSKG